MDYRNKPFAELYLDVLCDDAEAAFEMKRRLESGDGVPKAPDGFVDNFFDKFTEPTHWPQDLPILFMNEYFSKVEETPIERVNKYPVYNKERPALKQFDQDLFEHAPKSKSSKLYDYLHLRWLGSFVEAYDYLTIDKKHGRGLGFPRAVVAWGIETALRQNKIQMRKDGLLTRAFHRFHPEFFKKLGVDPIYEKDERGAYEDICLFLELRGKSGPFDFSYSHNGDFYASCLTWYDDDTHKPYLPSVIVGEILYSHGDARYKDFINEKQLQNLPGLKKIKTLKHPKLLFIGDSYYFGNKSFEVDGEWHYISNTGFKVTSQKDGSFLVEYENDYYKYSPLSPILGSFSGKTNWDKNEMETKTGNMVILPNTEYEISLYYPRYEHASGYTNNFCACKIKIVEE